MVYNVQCEVTMQRLPHMNPLASIDSLHERVDSLHERVDRQQEHVDSLHERVDRRQGGWVGGRSYNLALSLRVMQNFVPRVTHI